MPYKDKEKQREYQRLKLQETRNSWIESQGSICATPGCGNTSGPWEVDHINPSTKISHRVWSWSESRRAEELSKCQLLCQQCHWNKTGKENSGWEHGQTGYSRYKCRCDVCVTITNEKKRENRARRKALGLRVS